MKRLLLFATLLVSGLVSVHAQANLQAYVADSIACDSIINGHRLPMLMDVSGRDSAMLYAEPSLSARSVRHYGEFPLYLQGEEGKFWACSYFGKTVYIQKTDAENTPLIERTLKGLSQRFLWIVAYNAWNQGLKLNLMMMQEALDAMVDENAEPLVSTLHYKQIDLEGFEGAGAYFEKQDPKRVFGLIK